MFCFGPLQKAIKKFQEEQLHYGKSYAQGLKLKLFTEKIIHELNSELTKTIGKNILNI